MKKTQNKKPYRTPYSSDEYPSTVDVKINKLSEKIFSYYFGDLHIGHQSHDVQGLKGIQKVILDKLETYKVLVQFVGDIVDNTLPSNDKFSQREHLKPPMECVRDFADFLRPLVSHPNFIFNGILHGNHEWRTLRQGIDPLQAIFAEFGDKYHVKYHGFQNDNIVRIHCGNRTFRVRTKLLHQTRSNTLRSLQQFARDTLWQLNPDKDVVPVKAFLAGHSHELFAYKESYRLSRPEPLAGEVPEIFRYRYFIARTGSIIKDSYDSYCYTKRRGIIPYEEGYVVAEIGEGLSRDDRSFNMYVSYDGLNVPEFVGKDGVR